MELLVIIAVIYAVHRAIEDSKSAVRKSRGAYVRSAETRFPKAGKSRRVAHAARHDAGFWIGQAANGFPAARHGLAAGWHAGRQAQAEGRVAREEAKADHLETRVRLIPEVRAHVQRQREALERLRAEREAGEGSREDSPQPVMAPPSWSPGVVGWTGPASKNSGSAASPGTALGPGKSETVPGPGEGREGSPVAPTAADPARAPRVCVACGNPEYGPRPDGGIWGPLVTYTEPLFPDDTGGPRLIHKAHFEEEGFGFYGRPYEDAPAQDGTSGQPQEETEGSGEGTAAPETEPPASPTEGESPMAGEVTYDGVLASLAADSQNAASRTDEQAKAMRVAQDTGEAMQTLNMDAKVLSAMADHLDANQAAYEALLQCQETADQAAFVLRSNHQLLADAHKDAPVQAADREFYDA